MLLVVHPHLGGGGLGGGGLGGGGEGGLVSVTGIDFVTQQFLEDGSQR